MEPNLRALSKSKEIVGLPSQLDSHPTDPTFSMTLAVAMYCGENGLCHSHTSERRLDPMASLRVRWLRQNGREKEALCFLEPSLTSSF